MMLHGSLPVLGRSPATDRLELIGTQPRPVEQHPSISGPFLGGGRRPGSEVHHSLVAAACDRDVLIGGERRWLYETPNVIIINIIINNKIFNPLTLTIAMLSTI